MSNGERIYVDSFGNELLFDHAGFSNLRRAADLHFVIGKRCSEYWGAILYNSLQYKVIQVLRAFATGKSH